MPFDVDQPRDEKGMWTDTGSSNDGDNIGGGNSIHNVEGKIKNNNYESAAAFDDKGQMIVFKKGDQNTVHFTAEEKAKMKGATITHNHPSGQSFSVQDIQMVSALRLGKLRVVSVANTYEFQPPEKGLKPTWAAIYHDTEIRVNNKLVDDVRAGKLSEKLALAEIDHLIMTSFSKKIRAKYTKS